MGTESIIYVTQQGSHVYTKNILLKKSKALRKGLPRNYAQIKKSLLSDPISLILFVKTLLDFNCEHKLHHICFLWVFLILQELSFSEQSYEIHSTLKSLPLAPTNENNSLRLVYWWRTGGYKWKSTFNQSVSKPNKLMILQKKTPKNFSPY